MCAAEHPYHEAMADWAERQRAINAAIKAEAAAAAAEAEATRDKKNDRNLTTKADNITKEMRRRRAEMEEEAA